MKALHIMFLVTLVVGGFYFAPDAKTTEEKEKQVKNTIEPKVEPKKEALSKKVDHTKNIAKASGEKTYNIKKPLVIEDAFEYADIEEMKTKLKTKQKVEPIGAYTFKKNSIKGLFMNDTMTLPEINGQEYTVKTETTKVNSNGSITVKASIEGQGAEYYAIMTEGEKTSFITLNTSEGVFELETLNGNGYIYSSADMNNNMIDHSKTDAISVPK